MASDSSPNQNLAFDSAVEFRHEAILFQIIPRLSRSIEHNLVPPRKLLEEGARQAPVAVLAADLGLAQDWGYDRRPGNFQVRWLTWSGCVAWILRLVKTGAEGDGPSTDVMETNKPDNLGDVAHLGLTLAEAKQLLANLQQEIVAAQARTHAVLPPDCPCGSGVCHVKDHREHAVATLFGRATVRLPRFRCAACSTIEVGFDWPPHCRSTPELERLQAHLSALMTYRTAADILEQMFPVDTGKDKETLRRHTLRAGVGLRDSAVIKPETPAPAITVTVDSTFIRSCEDSERHLEVRVGNVEMASGGRQIFGAVAGSGTDIESYSGAQRS
jgi:hypothetical protein